MFSEIFWIFSFGVLAIVAGIKLVIQALLMDYTVNVAGIISVVLGLTCIVAGSVLLFLSLENMKFNK